MRKFKLIEDIKKAIRDYNDINKVNIQPEVIIKGDEFFKDYPLPDGKSYPIALTRDNKLFINSQRLKDITNDMEQEKKSCIPAMVVAHELAHIQYDLKGSEIDEITADTIVVNFVRRKHRKCFPELRKMQSKLKFY